MFRNLRRPLTESWLSHSQPAGSAPGCADVQWSRTGFRLEVSLLVLLLLEAEPEGKPGDETQGVTGLTEQSCVFVTNNYP